MPLKHFVLLAALISAAAAAQTPLEQGRLMLERQDYEQMRALLGPLKRSHARDAGFWYLLGRAEFGLGEVAAAEQHLRQAAELRADDAEYQFWFGQSSCALAEHANMLRARGLAIRCRDAFQAAADLEPGQISYQQALARFHIQAPAIAGGDIAKAQGIAARMRQTDLLQGQLLELEIHAARKDFAAFEELLSSSAELRSRPEPFIIRGFHHQRQKAYDQAIADFANATQKEIPAEDTAGQEQVLRAWYQVGRSALLGNTQLDKGIAALQHYRSQADYNEWAEFRLAQLFLLQGETGQARQLIAPLEADSQDKRLRDEIRKLRF